jgi:hypothetical protein
MDMYRFRRMTIAEYILLSDQLRRRDRRNLVGPALICSVIANVNRDAKKKPRPFKPEDFLPPDVDQPKREINESHTPEQMLQICQMMFGGGNNN